MSRYDWDLDKARVTGAVGIRRPSAYLVRAPFVASNLCTRSTMTRVLPRYRKWSAVSAGEPVRER